MRRPPLWAQGPGRHQEREACAHEEWMRQARSTRRPGGRPSKDRARCLKGSRWATGRLVRRRMKMGCGCGYGPVGFVEGRAPPSPSLVQQGGYSSFCLGYNERAAPDLREGFAGTVHPSWSLAQCSLYLFHKKIKAQCKHRSTDALMWCWACGADAGLS